MGYCVVGREALFQEVILELFPLNDLFFRTNTAAKTLRSFKSENIW